MVAACGVLASYGFSDSHAFSGGGDWSARAVIGVNGLLAGALASIAFVVSRVVFDWLRERRSGL